MPKRLPKGPVVASQALKIELASRQARMALLAQSNPAQLYLAQVASEYLNLLDWIAREEIRTTPNPWPTPNPKT